jgi:DNA-3-methyladenine glycosylase
VSRRYRTLRRRQLPSDTTVLARFLLGTILVHDLPEGRVAGRIVETEAYLPGVDPASHAYRGPTKRNRSMFLARGFAYVYFIYGMQYCFNVSSEKKGIGAAILIRALEPLEGLEIMRARRGVERERDLARGPGRLTQAFGIGPLQDGVDLCSGGPLRLAAGNVADADVATSVRIGLTKAVTLPLRFYVRGSAFVSGPRTL